MKGLRALSLLLCILLSASYGEEVKDLNILTLLPITGTVFPYGNTMFMVMNMALDDIEHQDDVLRGYKMNFIVSDDKVRMLII